jgi:hypothetical protein
VPKSDFGDYKEYSVIFTNRSLNLMSDPFQRVMRDLNNLLKATYNADKIASLYWKRYDAANNALIQGRVVYQNPLLCRLLRGKLLFVVPPAFRLF